MNQHHVVAGTAPVGFANKNHAIASDQNFVLAPPFDNSINELVGIAGHGIAPALK